MAQIPKKRLVFLVCQIIVAFSLSVFLGNGCSKVKPAPCPAVYPKPYKIGKNWYQPLPCAKDFSQHGKASWYGKKFHGRKTSNGEIYDMYAMTAAHKTLPLGTVVRVQNLDNNREVEVRINDRGPFVRGRIIDLSYTAAKKIGIVGPGTAPVKIVALGAAGSVNTNIVNNSTDIPANYYYTGNFTVQVGAFRELENAKKLKQKLGRIYRDAHITTYYSGDEIFFRVRVARTSDLTQIAEYEKNLIQNGFADAFAVAE